MNRQTIFVALASVLLACERKAPAELTGLLPVQVQREWRLHDAAEQAADTAPAEVKPLGVRAWALAHYQANGTVTVALYELGSETGAFEALQKWHNPQSLGFFKGKLFGTASSESMKREELAGFASDLQRQLKEAK